MQSFTFHAPTEIAFGKGAEAQTGALVKKYGGTRVFVVYGGGSAARSGLVGRVTAQLRDSGILFKEYGGAMPNPHLSYAILYWRSAAAVPLTRQRPSPTAPPTRKLTFGSFGCGKPCWKNPCP
jgi:hypothetical protein